MEPEVLIQGLLTTHADGITEISYHEALESPEAATPATPAHREERPLSAAARSSISNARAAPIAPRPSTASHSAALSGHEPLTAAPALHTEPWVCGGEREVKFQTLSTGTFAVMQARTAALPYRAWMLQVGRRRDTKPRAPSYRCLKI